MEVPALQNGNFKISCFFLTSGAVTPILQTRCVIIIAIDIDVHAIENHFQNLARTFVTPLGDFHLFFFAWWAWEGTLIV